MTEYWVSQGNKWCEYCKIFISNNPVSIRTHEFGKRHKENVANKLATIRKDNANKEKEKQHAIKDFERIEQQAKRSYEKDLAASQKASHSATCAESKPSEAQLPVVSLGSVESAKKSSTAFEQSFAVGGKVKEWAYDDNSGYYYDAVTGYYYDPKSGLYYNESLGKWITQTHAVKASQAADLVVSNRTQGTACEKLTLLSGQSCPAKPFVKPSTYPNKSGVEPSQHQSKTSRGMPSSIAVRKRKQEDKAAPISKEESEALASREAARKRMQEREKSLFGLYQK